MHPNGLKKWYRLFGYDRGLYRQRHSMLLHASLQVIFSREYYFQT